MATETKEPTLLERLRKVQQELKVPKAQRNTFGNYNYRNAEDILEAVKPLLEKHGLTLVLNDELLCIGERYYVKATVHVHSAEEEYLTHAYAREEETKKGMDGSQITGASSSYARKYALNGLFLIDDTRDSDSTNTHDTKAPAASKKPTAPIETDDSGELLAPDQITELMGLAKKKGYTDKKDAVAFLDAQAHMPFTKLRASEFGDFKKGVIGAGWKKTTTEPESLEVPFP